MKRFLSFFTASCLGTLAAIAIIGLVLFLIGMGASKSDKTVKSNSILVLKFEHFIPEKTNNIVEQPYSFQDVEFLGLRTIKRLIKHAKTDDRISGILLDPKFAYQDQVKVFNLKSAIEDFKESEKFVYAFSDFYTQPGYQMSTGADSIFLNPNGAIDLKGFAIMYPFYKDVMDKLGVSMNIFYAGDFKSATEPYRRNDMSEASKIQSRAYIDELNDLLIENIASDRDLEISDVEELKNTYAAFEANTALYSGLVDGLKYWDEMEDFLKERLGLEEDKGLNLIELDKYSSKVTLKQSSDSKDKIAIVYAEGDITYGEEVKGQVTNGQYVDLINKLRDKENIKAIVLRVNSPGGSGFSSDVIWRELDKTSKDGTPIVASMGSYAASGGYYIAAMADTIVAEPATLTGSIGVYMMFPNFRDLLSEKIGIHFDTVSTSPHAAGVNPLFDLSNEQIDMMQKSTDRLYAQFLSRVAEGRGMTSEQVHNIAQGRIWSGKKAKELGLVDELGDLDHAIELAAEMSGLESYKIVEYPVIKENPWKKMISSFSSQAQVKHPVLPQELKKLYPIYKDAKAWLKYDHPQARLPLIIN